VILADTHLLLWSALGDPRLSSKATQAIVAADDRRWFSAASIWEVAIKRGRHAHFNINVEEFRRGLLGHGWSELPLKSEHGVAAITLPPLHKDPFDRILLAQAKVEGLTLLTSSKMVARYPGKVMKV
jgi:PIN domain nuclease of toxin-antitoxin system